MTKARSNSTPDTRGASPAEALDALNSKLRTRKDSVPREIEATIESKAKKRRAKEKPLSSALKKT